MNEEIKAWLASSRDFARGVELYVLYGSSGNLKRLLTRQDPSPAMLETLVHELTQLLGSVQPFAVPPKRVAPVQVNAPAAPVAISRVGISNDDKGDIAALLKDIKMHWKALDTLHATLELVGDDQRRHDALMILDVADELDAMYQRKNHYEKYGVLPPVAGKSGKKEKPSVSTLDPVELIKARTNIRSHISRIKGYLKNPGKADKQDHYQLSLAAYEEQLFEVDKLLAK